jgi:hypothetical protein
VTQQQRKPLTMLQMEVLFELAHGKIIIIDKHNMATLADRPIQPMARYFLTRHRLVTRLDKGRSVEAAGNGFTITEKGRRALSDGSMGG